MSGPTARTIDAAADPLAQLGAAELARRIAAGDLSSAAVVDSLIARIEQVNPQLNAVVVPLFDQARDAARKADDARRHGDSLGPLHGVPITVKECFHVAGTPSTMGLTHRAQEIIPDDGVLVRRLRQAGAILLGKTNVPQLMVWHESVNPVYGRTNNPWDLERGPGGSTGGEAAIIAAGGSPLGLGGDLGGSIRIPGHVCGIHGIKPTTGRLPRSGTATNLRGMETLQFQPGPLARRVEDLWLALRVLADPRGERLEDGVAPGKLPDPAHVVLEGMRVAMWTDDGYFRASPAIRRAVDEAAELLRAGGMVVEPFTPPAVPEAIELYFSIVGADGGADFKRLIRGSAVDPCIRQLMLPTWLPNALRPALAGILLLAGQRRSAEIVRATRARSADSYWQLTNRLSQFQRQFQAALAHGRFDAMICPPHALPAMPHGSPIYLFAAASYSYLMNALGFPAGVVAATRVRADEQDERPSGRDLADRHARKTDTNSAGLPVGVQVAAGPWREDIVLAIMSFLEAGFCRRSDYPILAGLCAT